MNDNPYGEPLSRGNNVKRFNKELSGVASNSMPEQEFKQQS
jgi:hypothetical protein